MKKLLALVLSLTLVFSLAACGEGEDNEIELAYVNWAEGVAMTYLAEAILEDEMGYEVEATMADAGPIFSDVSQGNVDAFLDAWLPLTHGDYEDEYGDDYDDLGKNYEGARIGLVVPEYVDIDSIADLDANASDFDGEIVGIESGAGIMSATETAISEDGYDMQDTELLTSSGPAMVSELGDAIENEEDVVVTGWSPHYKFAEYDLKYLEDPEEVYGGVENIHSISRSGLDEDHPEVVTFLENFYMDDTELGSLMGMIANDDEDRDEIDIARDWMEDNEDVWSDWVPSE